ncbi:hypothetical protein [Sandaracinobacteroides saxicola]|uniref:DUF2490 domain-containing protein n=1 Tax=Sandaracinobacteroides saxicola TaxID=2759707 RepID=A0A7G5IKM6_9SPHN|nr:hypothetical protein [Sandaracinobacteroides saxicola]QMW23918.1 hypothetical protein H3309_05450 [Sandaracinobacteroides saxicola]
MTKGWTAIAVMSLLGGAVDARPVSYPGGWTLIQTLEPDEAAGLVHYTPNRHWSVGVRGQLMRESDWALLGVQPTWLVKRWNGEGSQANLYLSGVAGVAWRTEPHHQAKPGGRDGVLRPAVAAEIAADWETRRWLVMAMARVSHADTIERGDMQRLRAGFAPWIGDYGDVHLWLFGQLTRQSASADRWQPALVARAFWKTAMLEAGVTDRGGLILNSTFRF